MAKQSGGKTKGGQDASPEIGNPRARHRYELLERIECGIALVGPEVKSIRAGKASIDEGFARFKRGQLWLMGVHIAEYAAKGYTDQQPVRARKLLLHKRELLKLRKEVERKGLTLVPLRIYFNDRNLAKCEIALARGRKLHDKREVAKERVVKREIARGGRR